MKFQEIEEGSFQLAGPEGLDMYHKIYQNCQPFLQEIHDKPAQHVMYRGISNLEYSEENSYHHMMGIKDVRQFTRLPKDTSQRDHDEINQYLDQQYGHPYRNGLFVTGLSTIAATYGTAFAIFPIGKFDYIWHPRITDLYTEFLEPGNVEDHWEAYGASLGIDLSSPMDQDTYQEENGIVDLIEFIMDTETGYYKTNELIKGIKTARTEIMIWVEQYYYMNPSYLKIFEGWLSK